jgi:hypothetical protein
LPASEEWEAYVVWGTWLVGSVTIVSFGNPLVMLPPATIPNENPCAVEIQHDARMPLASAKSLKIALFLFDKFTRQNLRSETIIRCSFKANLLGKCR